MFISFKSELAKSEGGSREVSFRKILKIKVGEGKIVGFLKDFFLQNHLSRQQKKSGKMSFALRNNIIFKI